MYTSLFNVKHSLVIDSDVHMCKLRPSGAVDLFGQTPFLIPRLTYTAGTEPKSTGLSHSCSLDPQMH